MDRRDFLKSTGGLAALAAGCTSATATAVAGARAEPHRLNVAYPWAEHHAGLADDARRLARAIAAALGADVAVEIRPGFSGPADFRIAPVQSETARHLAFAYFGGLPGAESLAPRELETWLAVGGGQELWDRLAEPHGFKPLLAGHTGSSLVLWSRTPIHGPEDMAGRRVIARGLDAEVVRALGAIVVAGDETLLEQSLADPSTDALVWGGLVHASALGIPKNYPYGLAGALGRAGGSLALNVDLDVWNRLPAATQSAVAAVAQAEFSNALAESELTRPAVEEALRRRDAVTIMPPTADFSAAVSRIAAAVVAHAASSDPAASRIDRSYTAFRRAVAAGPAIG